MNIKEYMYFYNLNLYIKSIFIIFFFEFFYFLAQSNDELSIDIELDEAKRTISLFDSGVGMDRNTLIEDLGTIARSGSKNFIE
jgi:hypothetical protein